MKVIVADKILEMLGLEKTSDNYQKIYRIGDLILDQSDDYFVLETAIKRGLVEKPICKICGQEEHRSYSFNGVLDSQSCDNVDILGKHKV